MSVLRDQSIREMIERGVIGCVPMPGWDKQLQPASLDLRLSNEFADFKERASTTNPTIYPGSTHVDDMMNHWLANPGGFDIAPGVFVLGSTFESIRIPNDMVARVEGRSTLARMGLAVHITAGFIDPGFHGQITLEIINHGSNTIRLTPGMRICQICFERMDAAAENPYTGKYQDQCGVTTSRTHLDEKGGTDEDRDR